MQHETAARLPRYVLLSGWLCATFLFIILMVVTVHQPALTYYNTPESATARFDRMSNPEDGPLLALGRRQDPEGELRALRATIERLAARKALPSDPEVMQLARDVIHPPLGLRVRLSRGMAATPQAAEVDRLLQSQVENNFLYAYM